jgi:hypothetical protein
VKAISESEGNNGFDVGDPVSRWDQRRCGDDQPGLEMLGMQFDCTDVQLTSTRTETTIWNQKLFQIRGIWRKKLDLTTDFEVVVQLKVTRSSAPTDAHRGAGSDYAPHVQRE